MEFRHFLHFKNANFVDDFFYNFRIWIKYGKSNVKKSRQKYKRRYYIGKLKKCSFSYPIDSLEDENCFFLQLY